MTGHEKLRLALAHSAGPVPFDLGGTPVTGIHCSTLEKLRAHYGLTPRPVTIVDPFQMLGRVEEDLIACLGVDTEPFWSPATLLGFENRNYKEWRTPWGQEVLVPGDFNTTRQDGKTYLYAMGDTRCPPAVVMPETGYFFDAINRQSGELDDDTLRVEDNLEEFGPLERRILDEYGLRLPAAAATGRGVVASFGGTAIGDIALVPGPMLRRPKGIRDITEWYMSTVTRPGHLHAIFERQTEIALDNLESLRQVLGDGVDVVYVCGTDFGTQNGPFCSPETFRELYMPYYRRINGWIHRNTGWKTFKHSCGAVRDFIPDMIEAGFDILNPVQWTAKDMDMRALKEEFGRDIVFWGGGVDTQKTLPYGTPQQVRQQVLKVCEVFARNGGFVFAAVHNIQAKIPVENIVAMVDALHEFNR